MDVPVTVVGQKMFLDTGQHKLAPGSQLFVNFRFTLSEDWDGLTVFAQFLQNGTGYNQYLDSDNCAYLPAEIVSGKCTMMLYGTGNGSVVATTLPVCLCINNDLFVADGQSTVITKSLYDQLVSKVNQYVPLSRIASLADTKAYIGIT